MIGDINVLYQTPVEVNFELGHHRMLYNGAESCIIVLAKGDNLLCNLSKGQIFPVTLLFATVGDLLFRICLVNFRDPAELIDLLGADVFLNCCSKSLPSNEVYFVDNM